MALIYLGGLWLPGTDVRRAIQHVWQARNSILAVIVVQIVLILFLRAAALQDVHWWFYTLIYGFSAFGAVRCRLNPVLWIFFLAQALFSLQIQSWKYAIPWQHFLVCVGIFDLNALLLVKQG